jgi:hypothetical protein
MAPILSTEDQSVAITWFMNLEPLAPEIWTPLVENITVFNNVGIIKKAFLNQLKLTWVIYFFLKMARRTPYSSRAAKQNIMQTNEYHSEIHKRIFFAATIINYASV